MVDVSRAAEPWAVPAWTVALTDAERTVLQYAVVVTAFALAAMAARLWSARSEVGDRYRPAVHAGFGAVLTAFLSYVLLLVELRAGYAHRGGLWQPTGDAVGTWSARFMDWTVSVPLLVVELVAVSALTGRAAGRARVIGASAGVGMVVLGFAGALVVGGGRSFPAMLGFGIASSACLVVLYAVIVTVVLRSLPVLPAAARPSLRAAMLVLVVTWLAYPVVFGLQGIVTTGLSVTVSHLLLCAADLVAKVVFGLLLLRVARIRTAADVVAGEDVRPEGVWIDQLRLSHPAAAPPAPSSLPGD